MKEPCTAGLYPGGLNTEFIYRRAVRAATVTPPANAPAPPNFLIAGAGRAGTTSLWEWLRQHPDIFMSENKEPHFFVHGYGLNKWEDYLNLFQGAGRKSVRGESSTLYLFCEESASWIKSILGDVKIILLLRHPAKRAFSLYSWMVREGYEDAPTFEQALDREPSRLASAAFRSHCPQFYPDYLYYTSGLYYEQVNRFLRIFGRDRVRIYFFEDLVARSATVCRDVFEFLEVDSDFVPKFDVHNGGRIPASIPLQHWLRTAAGRWFKPVPRRVRRNLINGLMERNVRRGHLPAPSPRIEAMLTNRYRENIFQLQGLLGHDLSRWLKTASG